MEQIIYTGPTNITRSCIKFSSPDDLARGIFTLLVYAVCRNKTPCILDLGIGGKSGTRSGRFNSAKKCHHFLLGPQIQSERGDIQYHFCPRGRMDPSSHSRHVTALTK